MDWFFLIAIAIPIGAFFWVYRQAQKVKGEE